MKYSILMASNDIGSVENVYTTMTNSINEAIEFNWQLEGALIVSMAGGTIVLTQVVSQGEKEC